MFERSFVLIFDADNTLWDTNAVFLTAHTAMLEVFVGAGLLARTQGQVETVRVIDRTLMQHCGRHEYDFTMLVTALAYHYRYGLPALTAVARAVAHGSAALEMHLQTVMARATRAHRHALTAIPPLLPGVSEVLASLQTYRTTQPHMAMVMFSEGRPERLECTIAAHGFRQQGYFDVMIMETKTVESFQRAGETGQQFLPGSRTPEVVTVVIGDSMQRDIRHANAAGFTTVYIPADFEGQGIPQTAMDQPHFQLESIRQLPSLLATMGVSRLTSSGVR